MNPNALVDVYGADPTGTSDSHAALQSMSDALDCPVIPPGVFRCDAPIRPRTGQTWWNIGATLLQHDRCAGLIEAIGADDISFLGRWKLVCDFGGGSSDQVLFLIMDCLNLKAENFSIRGAVNIGILFDPTVNWRYGPRSQFSKVDLQACYKGLVALADGVPNTDAEYNCFSQVNAEGCTYPIIIAAGNTRVLGANVKYNTHGPRLLGGSNNGHGQLIGINSNHNELDSLHTDSVDLGFEISASSFIGPVISLLNSKGIRFNGGCIDCPITVDGPDRNYLNNVRTGPTYSVGGTNPENLIVHNLLA